MLSSSNCVIALSLLRSAGNSEDSLLYGGIWNGANGGPFIAMGSVGTCRRNTGFSGRSLEDLAGCFVSGVIATPISSGLMLLLENIFGSVKRRGGTLGGTFAAIPLGVPPGAPKLFSDDPLDDPPLRLDGSNRNGSRPLCLSLSLLLRRLKQAAIAIAPIASATAPTPATTMPAICGELSCVSAAVEAEVSRAEDTTVGPVEVVVELVGAVVGFAVVRGAVLTAAVVREAVLTTDGLAFRVEVAKVLLDGVGATCAILGFEVSIIKVAASVECVFGNAFGFPTHI